MYTIVVDLGIKEILVGAKEIDIDDVAYAADVQPLSESDNPDLDYEEVNDGDCIYEGESEHLLKDFMEEYQRKFHLRICKCLLHKVSTIPMMMTISTRLIMILRKSFGLPFQGTAVVGICYGGPTKT